MLCSSGTESGGDNVIQTGAAPLFFFAFLKHSSCFAKLKEVSSTSSTSTQRLRCFQSG